MIEIECLQAILITAVPALVFTTLGFVFTRKDN